MKRNTFFVLFLCIFCLCISNIVNAVGITGFTLTNNVEGVVGNTISTQTVTLELDDIEHSFNVAEDDNVTGWFTNIPTNLIATVSSYSDGSNEIEIDISGTPEVSANRFISVTIPTGCVVGYDGPLSYTSNEYKYIIQGLQASAIYYQDSIVSGYTGETMSEQYIYILVTNDSLSPSINAGDVFGTYNGMTITVKSVDRSQNKLVLAYNGVPTNIDSSLIHTTLPSSYLDSGLELVVPDKSGVKFNITTKSGGSNNDYVVPDTGI